MFSGEGGEGEGKEEKKVRLAYDDLVNGHLDSKASEVSRVRNE